MKKNNLYLITDMRRHTTKYGERLMVKLDNINKVYLPQHFHSLTDRQITVLGVGKYVLLNRGAKGQNFILEAILKMEFDRISLIEELSEPP